MSQLPKIKMRVPSTGYYYNPSIPEGIPFFRAHTQKGFCSVCGDKIKKGEGLRKDDHIHVQVEKQESRVSVKSCEFCKGCVKKYKIKKGEV